MGPVAYVSLCLLGCLIFNPSLAAPALSDQAKEASCPVGWMFLQGNCYGYFSQQKSWMEAEAECQRRWRGAHLASIHSAGENNILAHYVKWQHKKRSHVWIGLWDPDQNLTWRWTDESQMNFIAWDKGQPNGPKKKEHCIALAYYTGFQKWHDYSCENKYSYVCKNKPLGKAAHPHLGGSQHVGCE